MGKLKSGDSRWLDAKDERCKSLKSLCEFYIELGLCKRDLDPLRQYEMFSKQVEYIWEKKDRKLRVMIGKYPAVRSFLMMHSEFMNNESGQNRWFIPLMRSILTPDDNELDSIKIKSKVPQELLDKLEMFDPEPIDWDDDGMVVLYNIYDFEPIKIVDISWDLLDTTQKQKDAALPSEFKPILTYGEPKIVENSNDVDWKEDLPF